MHPLSGGWENSIKKNLKKKTNKQTGTENNRKEKRY